MARRRSRTTTTNIGRQMSMEPLSGVARKPFGSVLEASRSRWIDENSVLEAPRSRWIDENSVLEARRRCRIDENNVLEASGSRWIDENSVPEAPRSRWIDKNSVLEARRTSPEAAGITKIVLLTTRPRVTRASSVDSDPYPGPPKTHIF